MKYNKYAIKNNDGAFIKYGTAYSKKILFTNSLYDPHLFSTKKEAESLASFIMRYDHVGNLSVMLV